jgi:hypothetical protein
MAVTKKDTDYSDSAYSEQSIDTTYVLHKPNDSDLSIALLMKSNYSKSFKKL